MDEPETQTEPEPPPANVTGTEARPAAPRSKWAALYPDAYIWFIFLASLDIMLTYLIMNPILFSHDDFGAEPRGAEANAVANEVIQRWDVPGMVIFKFVLVMVVVFICEIIGRRRDAAGRRIAEWAVAITSIPIVIALIQMGLDLYFWFYPPH